MKLPFFSNAFVARLRENAAANAGKYGPDTSWLDTFAAGRTYTCESNQVVDPPCELMTSADDNAAHDAENAKRVFTWLRLLTPALAMEERLWACLTHGAFAGYMHLRWPVDGENAIRRRYLFEGKSFAALSRNGIARLWWAGYLTRDEERANPFELTDTLFLRQDIQVSLLERSMGKCRNVRAGVLEFLQNNRDWLSEEAFGRRIQILLRELNLLGGVAILDALPPSDIQACLKKVGESLAKEASTAKTPAGS
jgi:hypothetical protein